jgi:signal transduction histidine kinase/PAS domain-containing protein
VIDGGPPQRGAGTELDELLATLAEAPDLASSAAFLLSRLGDLSGSSRGFVRLLDSALESLHVVAVVGFDDGRSLPALSINDLSHPIVLSALSLHPIWSDTDAQADQRVPFAQWIALPLPRGDDRSGPPVIPPNRVADLVASVGLKVGQRPKRIQEWFSHAPAGVVVLEGQPGESAVEALARIAMYAGPILARMGSAAAVRQTADRATKERDRLTSIIDSLPDPIVITNAANDIIVQNARAERLLNTRESDSEGRRRAVEVNNLLFTSYLARAVMTGGLQSGPRELNLVDPGEGTDLLFEVLAHPLRGGDEGAGAVLSVLRDVTDLRRAGHELERQMQRVRLAEFDATRERDRLNLILENVADPILVTDDQSNIIMMNDEAERLFQVREGGKRNYGAIQAIRGNDTKFTSFISEFTLGTAISRRSRMALTDPSTNRGLPVEVVSGKIINEHGEPSVIVSVVHDLTKQVENERLYEELKKFSAQLEDRITAATSNLEAQNLKLQWQSQELARANRLKSEFLASMSHELRTPLNAVLGHTSLLLDRLFGEVTPQQIDSLERIRAAGQHLQALIDDILDLAKIEAGKMPLHLEEIPLREVLIEVAQQIEPMVRKKGLEATYRVAEDGMVVHTDRTKLKQILLNLLSNAVKFTHVGWVRLEATRHEDYVRIVVSDSGIGIKTEHLDAIWEDFRQIDQSRTREFGGTGLGLSITRKLLERLGGNVQVESTYGVGTTFTAWLPVRLAPMMDPNVEPQSAAAIR